MREIFQYVVHTGSRWNPKLKSVLLLKAIDHVFTVTRAEAKAIEDIATAFHMEINRGSCNKNVIFPTRNVGTN